jgi:hypothetical protein
LLWSVITVPLGAQDMSAWKTISAACGPKAETQIGGLRRPTSAA